MYFNIEIDILTNILLNVKCIGWCLSFSELNTMHGEMIKYNVCVIAVTQHVFFFMPLKCVVYTVICLNARLFEKKNLRKIHAKCEE